MTPYINGKTIEIYQMYQHFYLMHNQIYHVYISIIYTKFQPAQAWLFCVVVVVVVAAVVGHRHFLIPADLNPHSNRLRMSFHVFFYELLQNYYGLLGYPGLPPQKKNTLMTMYLPYIRPISKAYLREYPIKIWSYIIIWYSTSINWILKISPIDMLSYSNTWVCLKIVYP